MTSNINIATIILRAGLGSVGLIIIVFSTITTTFMDAYSAGISSQTLSHKLSGMFAAIVATIIGTIGALIFPMDNFSNFLYLIGSVFAPMIAIQITDYFIIKTNHQYQTYSWTNLIIWLIGFIIYRYLMDVELPIGSTTATILIVIILTWLVYSIKKGIVTES